MKKRFVFILVVFNSILLQAQTYSDFVRKGDSCYAGGAYKISVGFYEKAFKKEAVKSAHLYNGACSAALANESKSAFKWLNLAIDNGYENLGHLKKDRDLTVLHSQKEWKELIEKFQKKMDGIEANYDKPLQKELLAIYDEDQDIRKDFMVVYKDKKSDKKKIDSIGTIMIYKDSLNLIKVAKILDERGWVGKNTVGEQANQTLFLVIQHAPLKTQQKYLPMMRDAVKKGDAKAGSLALLEDRVALREGRKQIYGSQTSMDRTTRKPHISPMIDPDNVDKRRAEVGLGTMAEYAPKVGLVWNLEAYKKELPELEKLENLK
ncbi:DUF6624 domain-containing protein [Flavobacterium sp. FlaQc-52]|jgi:hypothetical protein|uniref:DUF6624 domain-containing protein n=1 Tax=Flavobacterium sp. FlaQc-52 TaxID=3374185 RepID=UPI0037573CEF